MICRLASYLQLFIARVLWKLSWVFSILSSKISATHNQDREVISSTRYDMVAAKDEPYYAEQYWNIILPHLGKVPENAKILDLGCSQGRFSIKLGRQFSSACVIGCDLSSSAILQAIKYASEAEVSNISFREQSIRDCLDTVNEDSVDAVFMTEVAFFYPSWKEDLPRIIKALKPGGIIAISFRSQYFNALCLARMRGWTMVDSVLKNREGNIFGPNITFTWQTSVEIKYLFGYYGLDLIELRGIGVCSGIPGDPHEVISRPSCLGDGERNELMKMELELGKSVPDAGRYILAVARKPLV